MIHSNTCTVSFFSNALNKCHESLNNNTLPILALCDGKDPKRSRLIGSIICNDWFTTLEVVSTGTIALSAIKNECHKIVLEHLKRSSVQERDVCKSKKDYSKYKILQIV